MPVMLLVASSMMCVIHIYRTLFIIYMIISMNTNIN
jgi:hypothetical protein